MPFHSPVPLAEGGVVNVDDWWTPVLLSLFAGLSTTLGGAIVLLLDGEPSKKTMSAALSLAGAVMVYVSVSMSVPRLLEGGSPMMDALGCLAAGIATFLIMQRFLPEPHEVKDPEAQPLQGQTAAQDFEVKNWRLGLLMMLVLSAHNFPEGLAVAVSAMDSSRLGIIVAIAIAAHNIPEGIVIAVPIYAATKSKTKAIGYSFLSGLTEPLGALCAVVFLHGIITTRLLEAVLCYVSGIMIAVSVCELFPAAWKYEEPGFFAIGAVAGCAVMAVTSIIV